MPCEVAWSTTPMGCTRHPCIQSAAVHACIHRVEGPIDNAIRKFHHFLGRIRKSCSHCFLQRIERMPPPKITTCHLWDALETRVNLRFAPLNVCHRVLVPYLHESENSIICATNIREGRGRGAHQVGSTPNKAADSRSAPSSPRTTAARRRGYSCQLTRQPVHYI